VINTVEFDGPDEPRLRRWIDGVIDALEAEPNDIPGLICAHLHVSSVGTRVLNFAEWTSEQAYDEALSHGPRGVGQTDLAEWQSVKDFPGVVGDTVNQYALHRSLATPTVAAEGS
jgi:Antibiotic biosynthesis monooxygenase